MNISKEFIDKDRLLFIQVFLIIQVFIIVVAFKDLIDQVLQTKEKDMTQQATIITEIVQITQSAKSQRQQRQKVTVMC